MTCVLDLNMNKVINFVSMFDDAFIDKYKVQIASIRDHYENAVFWCGTTKNNYLNNKFFFEENKINVQFVDEFFLRKKFKSNKMLHERISIFTMARLMLFEIFPDLYNMKNIIYLDADVVMNNHIENKLLQNGENFAVIDVHETLPKKFFDRVVNAHDELTSSNTDINKTIISKHLNRTYFNAGIIFINDTKKFKKIIERVTSDSGKNVFDDQTLLNYYNTFDEISIINDTRYNSTSSMPFGNDVVFFHFVGSMKPYKKYTLWDNEGIDLYTMIFLRKYDYFFSTEISGKFKKYLKLAGLDYGIELKFEQTHPNKGILISLNDVENINFKIIVFYQYCKYFGINVKIFIKNWTKNKRVNSEILTEDIIAYKEYENKKNNGNFVVLNSESTFDIGLYI